MDNIYSYLHEVWEPEPAQVTQTRSVPIAEENSNMDDIMSAYTNRTISHDKPFNVEGYNGPSQQHFYEIDKMYANDIKVLEKQVPQQAPESVSVCSQEIASELITNVVETFSDPVPAVLRDQYSELVIFLLSGVILIFMFDKLVHLGSCLGRK
jgi:hypothetical protein